MKTIKSYLYSIGMILGLSWIIWCNSGCLARTSYTEGLSISAGVYIPGDGTLYGLQLCNYVSGVRFATGTNTNFKVIRSANVCNNFLFGLISNSETNQTKIVVEKDDLYTTDDIKQ